MVISILKRLFKYSGAVGVLLVFCTLLSLTLSNSSVQNGYLQFWNKGFLNFPGFHTSFSLLNIINDCLMSVFFFSVSLEIKREMMIGELNSLKKAIMPLVSATGGMLVPALIYLIFCHSTNNYRGWAIPMATDIAFSLGILSLAGNKVPVALKIFLTAIAIIDDIGGMLTIAVFYTGNINIFYLIGAALIAICLTILNSNKYNNLTVYLLLGILFWYVLACSGIHPVISGVLLAIFIPSGKIHWLEHKLFIPVNYLILPLFALANTSFALPNNISTIVLSPIHLGVFLGLLVGKPIGIVLFTVVAHKMGIAIIPGKLSLRKLTGLGLLTGIGFTVSIFITSLAFTDIQIQTTAKFAVLGASLISGVLGFCFIKYFS